MKEGKHMRWRGRRQRTPIALALGSCDDLDVRPPQTHVLQHLVPSWWGCYGRFWNHLEVGHMVKDMVGLAFYKLALLLSHRDMRCPKPHCPRHEPHLTLPGMQDCTLSATSKNKLCSFTGLLPGNVSHRRER